MVQRIPKWGTACLVFLSMLFRQPALANQYDPHVYPSRGPFFEGWYARITDATSPRSFGVLFGRVLPKTTHGEPGDATAGTAAPPLGYLAILRSAGSQAPFVVAEAYPDPRHISVTVDDGRPVTENPDDRSPANFRWSAEPYGSFAVTGESTVFNFTIGDESLSGDFGPPVPWGRGGIGPEGWLSHLPLMPLHWFVYSLASTGTYTWESQAGVRPALHGNATMHQEKNWGDGFPPSWIWTQGVDSTNSPAAAFAGTFGVLRFAGAVSIPAHLFGFRDEITGLELDFRPDNSFARVAAADGCRGLARVEVESWRYRVVVEASAPPATLRRCLRGPTEHGFREVLVESFAATVGIEVYARRYFTFQLVERRLFEGAALEFGGGDVCRENPCTAEH